MLDFFDLLAYNNEADFGQPKSGDHLWRHNSVGRVAGSYPVCHLFKSDCRYQARWSSG